MAGFGKFNGTLMSKIEGFRGFVEYYVCHSTHILLFDCTHNLTPVIAERERKFRVTDLG